MKPLSIRHFTKTRIILVTLQLAYGFYFIFRSSMDVDGVRYFMLFDDAMISMSYARTFVAGEGLVWFPGADPVQGFTNPLWTLLMALTQLVPLAPRMASVPVQILGVILVPLSAICCEATARIVFPDLRASWIVLLLVGFYFPLFQWSGLGMEAGLITFLLSLSVYCVTWTTAQKRLHPLTFWALGAGILTRFDFSILAFVCAGFAIHALRTRPALRRKAMAGAAGLALLMAVICLAQWAYYGDPLPNTYALKLGVPLSVRLHAGLASNHAFALSFSYLLLACAAAILIVRRVEPAMACFLLALVSTALLYNLYAGGDAWEWGAHANRFQLPVVPIAFIALAGAIESLADRIAGNPSLARVACVGLAALVLLRVHSGSALDFASVRSNLRDAALLAPVMNREPHDLPYLKAGLLLRDATTRPLRVAVSSAGITPFVLGRGTFVDLLGKSDRVIART
ncbi:MAG: hypothetical protein GY733_01215, partial [bacterium]|nr:hypothetical protein [bacterium]